MNDRREFGDYQTPLAFAVKVCSYLKNELHLTPSAVIEPTCGCGNFLRSSLIFGAKEYYGIEINPEYCDYCMTNIEDSRVRIIEADFFSYNFKGLVTDQSNVLIIGNPPWVTNSELSSLGSANMPTKAN